jgi:predicted RNA-binding Zn-ribbon protein involved in translation (DUF1610 family)
MNKTEIKVCNTHGETLFVLRNDNRYRCKKCSVDAVHKRRHKLKDKAIEYKGGKCEKCGYSASKRALSFHHLDPTQKEFTISSANRSWDRVKNELDKCMLVCMNCHMELHDEIENKK